MFLHNTLISILSSNNIFSPLLTQSSVSANSSSKQEKKKKKEKKDWFYVFAIQKLVNSSNQTRRMKWSACCWKRPPLLHFQAEPAVFTGNVKPVYEEILQMLPRSRCDSCLRSQMRANQWNLCVWEKGRVVRPRVTITRSAHITHVASLWAMGCFVGLGFWGSI